MFFKREHSFSTVNYTKDNLSENFEVSESKFVGLVIVIKLFNFSL